MARGRNDRAGAGRAGVPQSAPAQAEGLGPVVVLGDPSEKAAPAAGEAVAKPQAAAAARGSAGAQAGEAGAAAGAGTAPEPARAGHRFCRVRCAGTVWATGRTADGHVLTHWADGQTGEFADADIESLPDHLIPL